MFFLSFFPLLGSSRKKAKKISAINEVWSLYPANNPFPTNWVILRHRVGFLSFFLSWGVCRLVPARHPKVIALFYVTCFSFESITRRADVNRWSYRTTWVVPLETCFFFFFFPEPDGAMCVLSLTFSCTRRSPPFWNFFFLGPPSSNTNKGVAKITECRGGRCRRRVDPTRAFPAEIEAWLEHILSLHVCVIAGERYLDNLQMTRCGCVSPRRVITRIVKEKKKKYFFFLVWK